MGGMTTDEGGVMTHAAAILDSHPAHVTITHRDLVACIDACFDCAQACTGCADACLAEDSVAHLRTCIRTNLDCADVCDATGRILSRHAGADTDLARAALQACITACQTCGEECERHAGMHEHCRVCAEACRACEQACRALLDNVG
jgi:hypothetical protein